MSSRKLLWSISAARMSGATLRSVRVVNTKRTLTKCYVRIVFASVTLARTLGPATSPS
jgi:hypothetical protein